MHAEPWKVLAHPPHRHKPTLYPERRLCSNVSRFTVAPPREQVLPGGSCMSFQCTFSFSFCAAPTTPTQVHTSACVKKTLGCKIPGAEVFCLKGMVGWRDAWVPPSSVDTMWRLSLAWYKWECSHLVRSPAETWERRFGCVGLLQTSCCASRFCSLGPYCSFYKHWFFIYIF